MLQPQRERLEVLEPLKKAMGSYAFAGQYQQAPSPQGGGLVKVAWFKRYTSSDKPERFDRVMQSWDTGNTASEVSDFSVCTTWGQKGKYYYLLHVYRERLEFPDLKRAVRQQQQRFGATVVLIEDKGSGTSLVQELNREDLSAVTRYKPEGDKITRMHAQTATIEAGRVLLPTEAPWLDDYLSELTVFPRGKYDDQVDSTSQFLDWVNKPMRDGWLYEYYRQHNEKIEHPERFRARMRPPPGSRVGHLSFLLKPFKRIGPDGIVEIALEDVRQLMSLGWTKVGERRIDEGEE